MKAEKIWNTTVDTDIQWPQSERYERESRFDNKHAR